MSNYFQDLRGFINFLDEHEQIKHVDNADWDQEIGGLTELVWRAKGEDCPALLFDNIPGYGPGYRVLTLGLATTFRYTTAIGLAPSFDRKETIRALKDLMKPVPLPPRVVENGPILENILQNGDIDVVKFPAPKYREHDGGRYIGTADLVFTRHAETKELNVGTYRVQVQGASEVSIFTAPGQHGGLHIQSYLDKGEPAPVLISLGHSPDLFIAGTEEYAYGVSELEMVGGRRGEPVDIIYGEVTGLPMPATAEIVLEGYIYPDSKPVAQEGPFAEFMGYYAGLNLNSLIPITIERIYHRNDPIILGMPHQRPPQDVLMDYRVAPRLWRELEDSDVPGIHEVNSLPFGSGNCNVVSMKTLFPGHSTQVAMRVVSAKATRLIGSMTIIVDDDIDVYDQDMVFWALITRCDPSTDLQIIKNMLRLSTEPLTHDPAKRAVGDMTCSRMVFDATRSFHWRDQYPRVIDISEELKGKLLQKYQTTLFDKL